MNQNHKYTTIFSADLSYNHCGLCYLDTSARTIVCEEIKTKCGEKLEYIRNAANLSCAILDHLQRRGGAMEAVIEAPLKGAPRSDELNFLAGSVVGKLLTLSPPPKIKMQDSAILQRLRGTGEKRKQRSVFLANFAFSQLEKLGWTVPPLPLATVEDGMAEAFLHSAWYLSTDRENLVFSTILRDAQAALLTNKALGFQGPVCKFAAV